VADAAADEEVVLVPEAVPEADWTLPISGLLPVAWKDARMVLLLEVVTVSLVP